jgi:hypothetical protein
MVKQRKRRKVDVLLTRRSQPGGSLTESVLLVSFMALIAVGSLSRLGVAAGDCFQSAANGFEYSISGGTEDLDRVGIVIASQ